MKKTKAKTDTTGDPRALPIHAKPDEPKPRAIAEVAVRAEASSAVVLQAFARGTYGDALHLGEALDVLRADVRAVQAGDMKGAEAMLTAQAAALNAMFAELARRAAMNMGEYLIATETYMRMALKAQAQCRATLETLAAIKNPPVVFARQANIAHGPQQVNNSAPPGAARGEGGSKSLPAPEPGTDLAATQRICRPQDSVQTTDARGDSTARAERTIGDTR